jgi:hypothetical protein
MMTTDEIQCGQKSWKILTGGGLVEIVDDVNGVFKVADGGGDKTFTLGLYSGETELDTVIFKIATSDFSGGLGTEAEPYLISNKEDLQKLLSSPSWFNRSDMHYIMTNDIDASGMKITRAMDQSACFKGVFDGNYHTIRNYQAKEGGNALYPSSQYVGLFGYNKGTIKNLAVENTAIKLDNGNERYFSASIFRLVSKSVFSSSLNSSTSSEIFLPSLIKSIVRSMPSYTS